MKRHSIRFIVLVLVFVISPGFLFFKNTPVIRLALAEGSMASYGSVENEYGTYNGELLGDVFSGTGEFYFLSGEFYSGDWKDSNMSGNGTLFFPGIGSYNGEMRDGKRNGQGTFKWDTGEEYTGGWVNDMMQGSGKYTFRNGGIFEGTFFQNRVQQGKYSYQPGMNVFSSESEIISLDYTLSDLNPQIVFKTKEGLVYEGDYLGLTKEGNATIHYPSGNTYTGSLVNGHRDGQGKYTWYSDGRIQAYYEGAWEEDKMMGYGEYHYSSSEYPYLAGSFVDDIPTGTLTYYQAAGSTFETRWTNGVCTSIKES